MNYNIDCKDITIKIFKQIDYSPYKTFYALAEWKIDNKLYVCNAEGSTSEEAYETIRRFLKRKGLGRISKENVISWPGSESSGR